MPLLPNQRLHLQREVCYLLRQMPGSRTKKRKAQEAVLTALTSFKGAPDRDQIVQSMRQISTVTKAD